ncbi:MAG: glycosyltransferase [Muribaculaceae bacterium]|nr:glycosyltransferase [Muribaculaceae bacterium]
MIKSEYAPIALFAYNRPDRLKAAIQALQTNPEASDSDLYIFIDGARSDADVEKVNECKLVASETSGFRNITVSASAKNKGLGPSLIAGITAVIEKYGKVIVIEDDLIVSPNFLAFINQGLQKYAGKKEVFSICGYTNRVKLPQNYKFNAYFAPRSSSWGWATWADRWNQVDWELSDWGKVASTKSAFNRWGGSDCFGMLQGWKQGLNRSWAIRFCYAQFCTGTTSLFPVRSLVENDGFDGAGTNCKKWSRFKYDMMESDKRDFNLPNQIKEIPALTRQALKYHSLPLRLYSKIMYLIYK